MRVTSVRVETRGAHEHVTVWVDGANVGTLIVGDGQGKWLADRLWEGDLPLDDADEPPCPFHSAGNTGRCGHCEDQ